MKHIFPPASRAKRAHDRRWTRSALLLAVMSAALAGGFYSLSKAVVRGVTGNIDREVLLVMREPGNSQNPRGPRWVEEMARDLTALGGVTVVFLLTFSVTAFFWLSSMRRAALYVAVASLGA